MGQSFTRQRVKMISGMHSLLGRPERLKAAGYLTAVELA